MENHRNIDCLAGLGSSAGQIDLDANYHFTLQFLASFAECVPPQIEVEDRAPQVDLLVNIRSIQKHGMSHSMTIQSQEGCKIPFDSTSVIIFARHMPCL